MAVLQERPSTEVTRMPVRPSHVTDWVLGIVGALSVGVGAWMFYVPSDWFVGGLEEVWYLSMFIAAGVLLATAFGIFGRSAYVEDHEIWTTRVMVSAVLALAAIGGAIAFALILILILIL